MENAAGITLDLKKASELKNMPEKYILLSDTNTDFTYYSVKVEDGNVILSANYTTIEACIELLFSELMGFDIKTGKAKKAKAKDYSKAFGDKLIKLAEKNEKIVAVTAAMKDGTGLKEFSQKFPKRFFDVGIAEQNLMGISAGMATTGLIPYASTFAVFAAGRAYDQVRNSIAYPKLNVKICATHAGITVGEDGATHQMLEDINLMRGLPNMIVMSPADDAESKWAVNEAARINGPVYIRFGRASTPAIYDENTKFEFGKAIMHGDGEDATVFATGIMVAEALKAQAALKEEGINIRVVDFHTIKPIDKELLIELAKTHHTIYVFLPLLHPVLSNH